MAEQRRYNFSSIVGVPERSDVDKNQKTKLFLLQNTEIFGRELV